MRTEKNLRKNKSKKYLSIFLIATLLLLCFGCGQKEEVVIETDYENGIYAPKDHHYILTLPSIDWAIDGNEASKNIAFSYKSNRIEVSVVTDNVEDVINTFPKEQVTLEQELKKEGYLDFEIVEFKSHHDYENEVMKRELSYVYLDYTSGTYVLIRNILTDTELFLLTAVSDANNYPSVQNSLNQFEILDQDAQSSAKTVPIVEEQNVYTSYDGMYTLLLPYESWNFSVDEENLITTLTTENKSLVVYEINNQEQTNAIAYEVPRTITSLKKQIDSLNLGGYKILSFHETTIDSVSDIEEKGNYRTFYYLLELENVSAGDRYYSFYEYRDENTTYRIIGRTTSPYLVDSKKLLEISKSFTLR